MQANEASTYDRVLESGKIRAAYIVYPPGSFKDPNTGELSGVFIDALNQAGEDLELEVEWTEEVAWGTMIEGLLSDRYDIVGNGIWETPSRGKVVDFTIPLFYSGLGVYVRSDENRFNNDIKAANSSDVKIAIIDGEISELVAKTKFPKAETVSLGQISDVSQMMLNVSQGKADVAVIEPYIGYEFLQQNPGTLKNAAQDQPIAVFGNSMMFKNNQPKFESMLNTALQSQLNGGNIASLMEKYIPEDGLMYPVAFPYRSDS
ncbi:substrate-binding periplasmic protein [Leptolyngbya sp. KIOST-1]|uniref:substrate-binding periplasmic protein n=1 Tax=Leptolyngbya sp. KIOST-1 TaxID=1229172 RepID=UPI0018CECC4A|nr:transporter substrate-binding domain-containing protein [Leptolyngbya sp. KIOST-1]